MSESQVVYPKGRISALQFWHSVLLTGPYWFTGFYPQVGGCGIRSRSKLTQPRLPRAYPQLSAAVRAKPFKMDRK
jgi:hypothetical protein